MRKFIFIFIAACLLLSAAGCGAAPRYSSGMDMNAGETMVATTAAAATAAGGGSGGAYPGANRQELYDEAEAYTEDGATAGSYARERKEIKNVSCAVIVKDVPGMYAFVVEIYESLGGYEFNKMENNYNGNISINLTVKLPPENLPEFERRLRSSAGENAVRFYNLYSDDITSSYYDVASRLDSMKASMAQYRELISKARNISDMLEIQREITRLQADIDSMQGQMNMWNMLVRHATITMSIDKEPDPLTQSRNEQWSFNTPSEILNSMGNGFISTGNVVYRLIVGFFVVLVSSLPVVIPVGIIVFIVIRRQRKRKAAILAQRAMYGSQPPYVQGEQPPFVQGEQPPFVQGEQPPFAQGEQPAFAQGEQPALDAQAAPDAQAALDPSGAPESADRNPSGDADGAE